MFNPKFIQQKKFFCQSSCNCDSYEWLLELEVDKKSPKFQGSAFVRFETDSGNGNGNNFKTEEQMFDVQFKSGETVQRDLLLSFPDLDADIRVEFFFASFSCDQKRKLLPVRFQAVRLTSGFGEKILAHLEKWTMEKQKTKYAQHNAETISQREIGPKTSIARKRHTKTE
uniref:MATH domain-containing protein n=1 Tax=Romanomermis culicivorax TaxID=13658 RepID=A0A915L047_ROMCU